MLEIKINKFDFKYLGIYSSVNVFVTLHLISSKTEDILWEAGLDELKAKVVSTFSFFYCVRLI